MNARVDVDYSGKEPKIKFGYTSKNPKKDAMSQHSYGLHTIFIIFLAYLAFGYMLNYNIEGNYPENCSVDFNEGLESINLSITFTEGDLFSSAVINNTYKKVIEGANVTCDGKLYFIEFKKDNSIYTLASSETGFYHKYNDKGEWLSSIYLLSILSLLFVSGYILNRLITFLLLKSERYRKGTPKFQAAMARSRKYMKFKPKDVESNMVEIPSFSNVVLEYKTDGDFSDKLQRIKIREHSWYRYNKKKKAPKKKIRRDVYKWYARFFFKETPKDGYLEVIYH